MTKKGIIVLGLAISLNAHAQDVNPYIPGTMPEGVVYYLPRTQLQIKVTTTRTTYTPGEFCKYADRYLRLQNISPSPYTQWDIKSIEIIPFGVPDPKLAYSIKLKDKSVSSQVELTQDGIIKAINTTSPPEEEIIKATPLPPTFRTNPKEFMTEEMLMAGSSIKMAELVAKEIYSIRESKNSLTRGQADYMPKDGSALQIMLNNLNKQEKALTEMFTGFTESTEQSFSFTYNPTTDVKDTILFRFSHKLGILKDNDLAGEPYYLSITQKETLPPVDEEGKKNKKLNGIIYNIPGKAKVTIHNAEKEFIQQEIPFAQFGETEVLVNNLFNKKVNTRVIFNTTTGAILKIDKD